MRTHSNATVPDGPRAHVHAKSTEAEACPTRYCGARLDYPTDGGGRIVPTCRECERRARLEKEGMLGARTIEKIVEKKVYIKGNPPKICACGAEYPSSSTGKACPACREKAKTRKCACGCGAPVVKGKRFLDACLTRIRRTRLLASRPKRYCIGCGKPHEDRGFKCRKCQKAAA